MALLVHVLPLLGDERDFALKGGTAINLFHRGMPRLSVDLDLTFLPIADREASLGAIEVRLRRIATAIEHGIPGSHARPVLDVRTQTVRASFRTEFEGMTSDATTATTEDLIATRTALVRELVAGMPHTHRAFLTGFKRGEPDWDLTGVPQIRDLPAVRWKQANLDRMTPGSRARAVERLEAVLGLPQR
ncbi:MAG: nucleotidyl transferase AbiEii/AbiGii toxin family protein [Trueperaceae bacterium]|nr:nucleotidyl transferase AbiEii/AbiGii toxin family protein [Trueperaceae bacterium]